MEYCVDRDCVPRMLVEDDVREASYQSAPVALVDNRIPLRVPQNRLEAGFDLLDELSTQSRPSLFVPVVGIGDVTDGFRQKDEYLSHDPGVSFPWPHPKRYRCPDSVRTPPFAWPILPFASREPAAPRGSRRCCPREPRPVQAFPKRPGRRGVRTWCPWLYPYLIPAVLANSGRRIRAPMITVGCGSRLSSRAACPGRAAGASGAGSRRGSRRRARTPAPWKRASSPPPSPGGSPA